VVRLPRRLGAGALAVVTAASLAGFAASPALARAGHGDPRRSVPPSQRFIDACFHVGGKAKAQRACDRAALPSFNRARATEGLAPMTLPTDFAVLAAPRQLLVLANIERVDRGLRPFPGLSTRLNHLAENGAKARTDPMFPSPFPGNFGGGNWAGVGTSTLLAEYVWMYDDGPHSPNLDCRPSSRGGCWGHRHNIIHGYDAPLAMGAAVAHHGQSMAEEFIGADHSDRATSPRWPHFTRLLPVGRSAGHLTVRAAAGRSGHRTLRLWASGRAMTVRIRLAAGHPIWSLSRTSCRLRAGSSCTVTVTEHPTDGSVHHASLTVAGPNGKAVVTLAGRPTG
jgi:VCBS repeat-containing protein